MGSDLSLKERNKMDKNLNILEKLQIISKREVKRREQAVNYLKKLTLILAPAFEEIIGEDISDGNSILTTYHNDMYFRYIEYYNSDNMEDIGFFVDQSGHNVWGTDLEEIRGSEFWYRIEQVIDWVNYYLPEFINDLEQNRERRSEQLEKLVKNLQNIS